MQHSRRAFAIYRRTVLAVTAIMAGVFYAANPHALHIIPSLAFLALAVTIELSPVPLGNAYSEDVVTFPVLWAAMLLLGKETAMFVTFWAVFLANAIAFPSAILTARWGADSVLADEPRVARRPRILLHIAAKVAGNWIGKHNYPVRYVLALILSNACGFALIVGLAGLAYSLVGGPLLTREILDGHTRSGLLGLLIPLAVGLFVYFVADTVNYSSNRAVLQIPRDQAFSWRSFYLNWRMAVLSYMLVSVRNNSFMVPFGILLSFLYVWWGPVSFIAVLVPFYAVRHTLSETMEEWQTYRDTITTMGTLMQHYHPYTRGHLRRVAELSERLAREVGRPPRNVMLMADAGMLHDVGKVGVSEEILDKVGKLSDEEWDVIRSHPTKGADILSNLPFLDQIVDWVRYHHKWANGAGYPSDEKHNGDIPVEASIIAVADAFDAMTDDREITLEWRCDSCGYTPPNGERPDECPQCHAPKRRVYREPLSLDEAIDQLRRGSGTQFRPELVQAFLTMIDRDGVRLNAD